MLAKFYVLDYTASSPVATAPNARPRSSLFLSSRASHQVKGLAWLPRLACSRFPLNGIGSFADAWRELGSLLHLQPFATCRGYDFWLEG